MTDQFKLPAQDCPTITAQELMNELMGKRQWTCKYVTDAIEATDTHLLFRDTKADDIDDGEPMYFWVPKSQIEPVNYVALSGIAQGAYKFPFSFVNPETADYLCQILIGDLEDNHTQPIGVQHKNGQIEATWNPSNGEKLPAPPKNGKDQHYLPCEYCGKLTAVDMNVVSHCCTSMCRTKAQERRDILNRS